MMAASRRAPTPLRSSTSSSPLEAMIATKQGHIEELVTQTRTLEHTITKLRAALVEEQGRAQDAVAALQKRWQAERTEWHEGCDNLQAAHRIAHLRTAIELDRERSSMLKEREALRKERLARLQRDFRLVMFQRRETELEERVADLEYQLEEVAREREREQRELAAQVDGKATALEARCEGLVGQLREAANDLAKAHKEKAQAEETASRLKSEHTTLLNSSKKTESSLERTTLQLDGAKSKNGDLEKKLNESEQTVSELRRQLEKWHKLENREGAEMDALRRERTELAVQVETLQTRVKELSERAQASEAAVKTEVEKRRQKNEEFQEAIAEWKTACDDAQREAEESKAEAERLAEQLRNVQKELKVLRAQPSTAAASKPQVLQLDSDDEAGPKPRKKSKPPKPVERAVDLSPGSDEDDIQEISESLGQPSQPPAKPQGHPKGRSTSNTAAGMPKNGRKRKSPEDSDIEELDPPKKSKKPTKESPRSRNKANESRASEEGHSGVSKAKKAGKPRDDDESDEIKEVRTTADKSKRKAAVLEEDGPKGPKKRNSKAVLDDQGSPGRKRTTSKQSASAMTKPSSKDARAKPPGRAQNKQSRVVEETDEPAVVGNGTPSKKKRKLNVFPSAANPAMKFNWDPLANGSGSLDIPTELSPVKDGEAVPPKKSVFSSFGSVLGSFAASKR